MIQGISISEMVSQSITVLTQPGVSSFEKFEKRGGTREALTYIILAAAIAAAVAFVFGIFGGVGHAVRGVILGFVGPVVGFSVFAWLIYYVGKTQGGTGSLDEVFYTFALFAAPLHAITGVVGAVPVLGCLLLPVTLAVAIYQAYLAYVATRSSMNLQQTPAIITVVVAVVADIVVSGIVALILGAVLALLTLR